MKFDVKLSGDVTNKAPDVRRNIDSHLFIYGLVFEISRRINRADDDIFRVSLPIFPSTLSS